MADIIFPPVNGGGIIYVRSTSEIPAVPDPSIVYYIWDGINSSKAVRYEFSDGRLQSDGVTETTLANLGSAQSAGQETSITDLSAISKRIGDHYAFISTAQFVNALDFGVPRDGITDMYPALRMLCDAIKSKTIKASGIFLPYTGNGYKISQQILIDFPLQIRYEDNITATFTTKKCVFLFRGTYSTTDSNALLKGCGISSSGRYFIDGNGWNNTDYTYSTSDTYYSPVLFMWCDKPYAIDVWVKNGLVNGVRSFQCREPLFHRVIGSESVWDNGVSIEFDPPCYLSTDYTTWSKAIMSYCIGANNKRGLGCTMYAAPMRATVVGCLAFGNGARSAGEVGSSGVIGGGISIEDDFNNKHSKAPYIKVINCHAWDNANGFFVSSDYVDIDEACTANDNTYPFDGVNDSANTHGNGYTFVNTKHIKCLGSSKGNFKRGIYGLGYQTLPIDQAVFGGKHRNNLVSGLLVQGAGKIDILPSFSSDTNGATQPAVHVYNLTDYNFGAGEVTIKGINVSRSGLNAIKAQGVGDVKVMGVSGKDNGASTASPCVLVDSCTKAVVDGVAFTGANNTNIVSVNSATGAAAINNVSGDSSGAKVINNAATPFDVNGITQSVGDASVTAWQGKFVTILFNAAITSARTVTLSTTNASRGDRVRVLRTSNATGAFTVTVGSSLKTLSSASTWADFEFDGTNWFCSASGSV